jgi:hypothetical protein
MDLVCERFGISRRDLLSHRRPGRLVRIRQAAFWLARQAGYTFPEIARACGDRDHTTIMHGVSRTEACMAGDDAFAALIHTLEAEVQGMGVVVMEEPDPEAVQVALEPLRDALVAAFAAEGWPRRVILPAPLTAAQRAALDGFIALLRLDLPDLVVVIRGGR